MSTLNTEVWTPVCISALWLPALPERIDADGQIHYVCHGLSGFNTRHECQAECDRRNVKRLGTLTALIETTERNLAELKRSRDLLATQETKPGGS